MAKPKQTKRTPIKKAPKAVKPSAKAFDTSWHPRFLEILGGTCNVTLAAKGAGVGRVTVYEHYKLFPDFAEAWNDAKEAAIELLEAEVWQRARKQSDLLAIFLLKAHKPQMYREKVDVTHGGELQHTIVRIPAKAASREDWERQQKDSSE